MTDEELTARRQRQIDQVQETAEQLIDLIASKPHATTLDALMLVYKQLAIKFPCCTQGAATCAWAAARELTQYAQLQQPGDASTAVH